MKALVLCAGLGTRLRPFTFSTVKHLIPVANRPVLFHVVDALRDVGATELGVVVSADSRPPIVSALGNGAALGVRVHYILQPAPRGLGHAVGCGRDFVGAEDFLVYLGDTLLPEGLAGLMRSFSGGAAAALLLKPVDDPRSFGIAVVEGGRVRRLVEKPREPPGNLAIAGAYAFTPRIFSSIARLAPSWRGEYEITDAIQDMIDRGLEVSACIGGGWWRDAGRPEDVIEANSAMLEELAGAVHGHVDERSRLEGTVVVGKGARVLDSVIRGPVIIGEHAVVEEAEVGPHVSIGNHARISHCTVRQSLVMEDAVVADVARPVVRSMIGKKAEVRGAGETCLIIGDHSKIEL